MYSKKYISKIGNQLLARKESIAIAESVTSGYLQFLFSTADNASDFFQGGLTAYNLGQKARHLGIDPIQGQQCDCVSLQTAREMALGVTTLFTSQWGMGITGYASPLPALGIKQPFAFYAIAFSNTIVLSQRVDSRKEQGIHAQKYFAHDALKSFSLLLKKVPTI